MNPENKSKAPVVIVVVLILLALAGVWFFLWRDDSDTLNANFPLTPATTPPVTVSDKKYKDGTYSATGEYISPGGPEQVGVELTLENDMIVDAKVTSLASRPTSVTLQGMFISGYKSFVVGKKIDEVTLDKVSGSSLTPKGFNDAVEKIKIQAKA